MSRFIKRILLWLFIIMISSFGISAYLFNAAGITLTDILSFDEFIEEGEVNYKEDINTEKSFAISDVDTIDIDTVSSDIQFITEDREDIKVHFYGYMSSSNPLKLPSLAVENEDGNLMVKIEHSNSPLVGFHSSKLSLDIYIPKDYSKNIAIKTTSGDIFIDKLSISNLKSNTISGDLNVNKLFTTTSDIKTTSGNLNIQDFSGDLDFTSISGDLLIYYGKFNNNINMKTTSGDLNIVLPKDSQFEFKGKTVSGDINCNFPLTLEGDISERSIQGRVGSGDSLVNIDTVSGNINIKQNE